MRRILNFCSTWSKKNNYKMMKSTRKVGCERRFRYPSLIFGSRSILTRTNNLSSQRNLLSIFYIETNISTRKSVEVAVDKSRGWSMGKSSSRLTIAERVFERGCTQWRREVRERDGVGVGGEKRRSKGRIEGLSTFSPLAMLSWGPSEGLTSGFVISASSSSLRSLSCTLSLNDGPQCA